MPEILWEKGSEPKWVPALNRIMMSNEPYYKERGPMVMAHEIGHWQYDQTLGGTDPLVDLYEERDAWRFALSKLPPDEIDLDFLDYSLAGYVYEVELWYGKGKELDMAEKIKRETMAQARKRKGV